MIAPDDAQPDQMQYGILGQDDSSTADKLEKFAGQVDWEYLRPHYQSGALFFVDPQLSLTEVGTAFTENKTAQVETWLKSGDLVKIEELHAKQWENTATSFEALVVSPFVLCRPV